MNPGRRMAAILQKFDKSPCLSNSSPNRIEIWHGDAEWPLKILAKTFREFLIISKSLRKNVLLYGNWTFHNANLSWEQLYLL